MTRPILRPPALGPTLPRRLSKTHVEDCCRGTGPEDEDASTDVAKAAENASQAVQALLMVDRVLRVRCQDMQNHLNDGVATYIACEIV